MAEPQKAPVAAAAKPKAVEAAAPTKAKFTVVSGKHRNDDDTFAYKGDVVTLDIATAAAFTNKFARVVVNAPAEDENE